MSQPESIAKLAAIYGGPSQSAFGSAVFHDKLGAGELAQAALAKYREFVGRLWDQYGATACTGPWKEVYSREPGSTPDIVSEPGNIPGSNVRLSVPISLTR